jgi:hypothetical protein
VVIGLSALGGALVGFGFGVRTDVGLDLLLILAAVTLFLPDRLAATWKVRLIAAALSLAAFGAVARPVLSSNQSGDNLWHWALLGYGHDFDSALGVDAAPYETGYFYDDSYVASIIDAYWGRTTGSSLQVAVGSPHYEEASRDYFRLVLSTFPADALLRGEAAVIKVLGFPFNGVEASAADALPRLISALLTLRSRLLRLVAPLAVPLFVAVVILTSLGSLRLAAALAVLVVFLAANPAVQFQTRHFFHLELLPLCMLGLCAQWRWPRLLTRRDGARMLAVAMVLVAVAVVPLMAARAHQQRAAASLLAAYVHAPVLNVPARMEQSDGGDVGAAHWADLLPHDDGRRSMRSEQLVVDVSPGCSARSVPVTFKYTVATPGHDYSRTFEVPVGSREVPTELFFTVYQTGASAPAPHHFVFDGVEVPAAQAPCIARIARFEKPESFPLLIPAVLPPGWQALPLHQTLHGWERPALSRVALE